MSASDASHRKKVAEKLKEIRAAFSDYENAVTLICSVEAWIEHEWGANGKQGTHLVNFDRFPTLDGNLTPDFIAKFDTPYVLCGEHKKNYHPSTDDRRQIIAYSNWEPKGKPRPGYDVLLLVSTHNDDSAAEDIYGPNKKPSPKSNVVIVGFFRDPERVNGEWFDLKWREHNGKNRKFTKPNVTARPEEDDLNSLLANDSHCGIRVDRPAIDLAGRSPLINDEPPPLYTAVRLVLPAINEILTEKDRDTLVNARRVEKTLSRHDILSSGILRRLRPREKTVQSALEFLVDIGQAKRVPSTDPPQYVIALDLKTLKSDSMELLSRKASSALVPKAKGPRGRPRKAKHMKDQPRLFD